MVLEPSGLESDYIYLEVQHRAEFRQPRDMYVESRAVRFTRGVTTLLLYTPRYEYSRHRRDAGVVYKRLSFK